LGRARSSNGGVTWAWWMVFIATGAKWLVEMFHLVIQSHLSHQSSYTGGHFVGV